MTTLNEILDKNKSVEFIKYQFLDMEGRLRETNVHKNSIGKSGATGVDGSSIFGDIVQVTESNMYLGPDTDTFMQLPWDKKFARVICNVYNSFNSAEDNEPYLSCPRNTLIEVEEQIKPIVLNSLKEDVKQDVHEFQKIVAHMSPELEFVMVPKDYSLRQFQVDNSIKNDTYYGPTAPEEDKLFAEILESLDAMGLVKEKYHKEVGRYQYEIGIGYDTALKMADKTFTAKYLIATIAAKHGFKASFIPKFKDGVNGNGMHVHQNLATGSTNLFFDKNEPNCFSKIGCQYAAGLEHHAKEITALTNNSPISYKRLVPGCEAPTHIGFDWNNRTPLIRGHEKGNKKVRLEYRAADPMCNPYLAFAGMISAGLNGIKFGMVLNEDNRGRDFHYNNNGVEQLPGNLGEAAHYLSKSDMLKEFLNPELVEDLVTVTNSNWNRYVKSRDGMLVNFLPKFMRASLSSKVTQQDVVDFYHHL